MTTLILDTRFIQQVWIRCKVEIAYKKKTKYKFKKVWLTIHMQDAAALIL